MSQPYEMEYEGLKICAVADTHRECMSIVKSLGLPAGTRVLDLGAGIGALSQRLLDHGFRVTAVDLAPDRYRAKAPIQAADLNSDFRLNLTERPSLITAIELVEHLQNPRHFIRQCLALLPAGGHLLMTSPNLESWVSRIRFLRSGRPSWFADGDYADTGHITPIFSWQVAQVCREERASLIVRHTRNSLLWRGLGGTFLQRMLNKTTWMAVLYPFMQGHKSGEINIFLIEKRA
jgi:2-polyprenyl-3-methyl-5-hydroxy-6-metoxy-1,4-benzoquinol methylase